MRETLTKQQLAAVESRGRSLLVSAAAGSGKTKVLVERLFSYVEHDGADLDDFLIITYTRAAASELRGKIARALSERLESRPDDRHLQRQLLRLYRADIKTVDAFCTALLRENCHLLGEDEQHHSLRPDFRVLDEQDASVLQERVLGRVLDRFYEGLQPGDGGMLLADTLGAGRDDSALAELVLELHKKLQAQPFEQEWLAQQEAFWRSAPQHVEDTPYGALLLRAVRRKARHWALLLRRAAAEMDQNAALAAHYAPSFAAAADDLDALCEAAGRSWDAARACEVTFPRLGVVKDADGGVLKVRMKSLWDACKASSKKLGDWLDASSAEAAEDLRAMAPAMCALIALTGEFSRAYQSEKRRRNAADFSDQEHEAIRLLIGADGAPTELAHTVSQRYREIMVDEYQDTNEVQNRIFAAISREGKNLFTVGDVKQSIYRFRLADPRIFLRHYRDYPPEAEAAEGESAKLLLSRNFRSRSEVLQATNYIFSNILSVEMGELEYGADERLYAGASYEDSDRCAAE
ncbi:MAG: UvrD-helicase domain-containing protein, partial [Oscillospiraceae bacterium]|nr:UvrD-helicase domain-containing protein [Oscillospiraceae bacterium]